MGAVGTMGTGCGAMVMTCCGFMAVGMEIIISFVDGVMAGTFLGLRFLIALLMVCTVVAGMLCPIGVGMGCFVGVVSPMGC